MKRMLLISALLTLSATLIFADTPRFTDVKAGDWFADTVTKLTARGGITGYDDGSFKPGGTITRAEYTAIVARSLGIKAKEGASGHWAAGLMIASQEAGLVKAGEFPELDKAITRNEMARMAVRALGYRNEAVPSDYRDYEPLIGDLAVAGAYKDDVAKVVAMGIITGYPDKTFQGSKTLTRAEASAVVMRVLDQEARKVPMKPSAVGTIQLGETKPVAEFISNVSELNKFNRNLKTVTLVTAESLGMTVEPSMVTKKMLIRRPEHTGIIVIVKDGVSIGSFSGAYMPNLGATYYDTTSFPIDYRKIDYYGFYRADGKADIQLVVNNWKE